MDLELEQGQLLNVLGVGEVGDSDWGKAADDSHSWGSVCST